MDALNLPMALRYDASNVGMVLLLHCAFTQFPFLFLPMSHGEIS